MAVKEKTLQGGGLGPVVGGEDHLPVGSNACLVLFLVSYPAGVLNSTTAHSKSTTVSNITLLLVIASPVKTYCMAKADNAFL